MELMAIAGLIQQAPWRPVVEVGTGQGGSALFWVDCGAIHVWTIDVVAPTIPFTDSRVTFLHGDSLEKIPNVWDAIVVLDGDHHAEQVRKELDAYASLILSSGYLIVCDTHFNGHPIAPEFGPGPWEAVEVFLATHTDFVRDRDVEPLLTFNPGGYLRRVK